MLHTGKRRERAKGPAKFFPVGLDFLENRYNYYKGSTVYNKASKRRLDVFCREEQKVCFT